jgi:DNA-binding transcriptional ArsR family regulator
MFVHIFNRMVEYNPHDLDRVFAALSDPTRRLLMRRLCAGPATVSELAAPLEMSLNAVSKHLKVLEQAGLIQRTIKGRVHHISLNAAPLAEAERWVNQYRQFWDARLDSLDSWLKLDSNRKEEE